MKYAGCNLGRYAKQLRHLCYLSCILVGPLASGQENDLSLSVDAASFQDATGQQYLEICYSLINRASQSNNGVKPEKLKAVINMLVFQEDSLWAARAWLVEQTYEDSLDYVKNREVIDLFRYRVDAPAEYRVVISGRNLEGNAGIDSSETVIRVDSVKTDRVEISDIILASEIRKRDKATPKIFVRNNYAVIPNAWAIFGENAPYLYYYFESYNLDELPGSKYKRLAYFLNSHGQKMRDTGLSERTVRKRGNSNVEMGMIDVSNVRTGPYTFIYGIADSTGNEVITQEKAVFVNNSGLSVNGQSTDLDLSDAPPEMLAALQALSGQELDRELSFMRYLVGQQEKIWYEKLHGLSARRQLLAVLWQRRASDENQPAIDYRRGYLERVKTATERFAATGGSGWKSDMGRVFILYGPATEVKRFPSTGSEKAHEIWLYDNLNGQTAVKFIFVDRFGYGRFQLVHATLQAERQDPGWRRFVESK